MIRVERRLEQPRWLNVVVPIASLVVAFLVIAAVLGVTGHDPITTYRRLYDAAFSNAAAWTATLMSATPLLFTGLCAAVAFRMKLYNIGGEGQLYLGALCSAGGAIWLGAGHPIVVTILVMCVCGFLGGALWALIPGVLKAFASTNEIITSLMLNYVAGQLLTYLIFESQSYWRETKGFNAAVFPTPKSLPENAVWPHWTLDIQGGVVIPLGLLLGLATAVVLWFLYNRTRFGFEVQVLSDSERAARYGGVRVRRKILAVMALSGAMAGIGGASQDGDFRHTLDPRGLTAAGYGYTGIVVAALGRYNPFAVVVIAFLLGGLQNAGYALQGADFPSGLVGVLQGLILFCVLGGEILIRHRIRIQLKRQSAEVVA